MSNELIRGKQSCNLVEIRFIRLIIAQILIEDEELSTYTTTVREFSDFFNIDASNIYRDIQTLCVNLRRKDVLVSSGDTKKPWKSIGWFDSVSYDGEGKITFKFSEEIRPYVWGLRELFTKCQLKNLILLHSVYSIRLYELILMEKNEKHKNQVKFSVSFLREILLYKDIGNMKNEMYPKFGLFRNKVIEPAIAEINKYTDIIVECEFIKTGRTITDVLFIVKNKQQLKTVISEKVDPLVEVGETESEIPDFIKRMLLLPECDIKKIYDSAGGNYKLIEEKYQLAKQQSKIANLAGWMLKAVKEDFQVVQTIGSVKKNTFNDFPQRDYSNKDFSEIEQKLFNIDYLNDWDKTSRRRSV